MKQSLLFLITLLLCASSFAQKSFGEGVTGYVTIPAGKVEGKEIPQFYMSATEVTNAQYREFLDALRASGDTARLKAAWPDSTQWNQPVPNPVWAENYFHQKAYDHYPMVCVSKRGAYLYCEWLAGKIKKGGRNLHVSLPTEEQWDYAARGGDSTAIYPWKGKTTKAEKGQYKGTYLANYRRVGDLDTPPVDTTKFNDHADITAPAESYLPNGYKLYNMAGNVAEMIADHDYTKGGSYWSSREGIKISEHENYNTAKGNSMVGFRPIIW
ncbi:MAG: SUMF1/EgtB/PvdO family nonheme iron enzyme [Bacteroidetes bacterium]|nr:SUMF1/EgtB/PvdO family nonheme iron enzyme [Bacteroidota bacterium]